MDNVDHTLIIKTCKELGCCNACCLRYIGLKNPIAFEKSHEFVQKYLKCEAEKETDGATGNGVEHVPMKKLKACSEVCVSCVGVLQEENWPACRVMLKEMMDKKRYECDTFACALSAPIVTILREKAITVHLTDTLPQYDEDCVTPLKEAWKWCAGGALARDLGKTLDSGAVSPLLVTLSLEYPDEPQELETLKALAPALFESRGRQRRRFAVEFTRRAAEQALAGATAASLRAAGWPRVPRPAAPARPVSAVGAHAPLLLAGRYVKLSRELPQTPWVLNGERMMDSSVQEIVFEPIARLYQMDVAETEHRLKFMSAGREDVDVRCLGTGRPFAIEVADPRRPPTEEELRRLCEEISASGKVTVKTLGLISRDKLAELKRGEESKCKTYEALCVKLTHTAEDIALGATAESAVEVTARDVAALSAWCGEVVQRTPLRVLHRRPLLARVRRVLRLEAAPVPGRAALLALRVHTTAGTYVKEWAHGDLRRTRPALADALGARVDILQLDVTHVHLDDWP